MLEAHLILTRIGFSWPKATWMVGMTGVTYCIASLGSFISLSRNGSGSCWSPPAKPLSTSKRSSHQRLGLYKGKVFRKPMVLTPPKRLQVFFRYSNLPLFNCFVVSHLTWSCLGRKIPKEATPHTPHLIGFAGICCEDSGETAAGTSHLEKERISGICGRPGPL